MRTTAAITLVASLAACTPEPSSVVGTPSGANLAAALQGAWCVSDDDGKSCWGFDRFDGPTIQACGRMPEDGKPFLATASFVVKEYASCYTVTTSTRPEYFPVGHQFCTKVLEINGQFQRYLLDGKIYKTYRVPLNAVSCPSAA